MEEKRRRKEVLKMKREEKAAKADRKEMQRENVGAKPQKSAAWNRCEKTLVNRNKLASGGRKGKEKASTSRDFQCAICFQSFFDDEEGEEWIECACGQWVHENCIEYDIVVDTHGRERLCPSCVM